MSHIPSEPSYHSTGFIDGTKGIDASGKERFYISGVDATDGIRIQTELSSFQIAINNLFHKWIPVATNQGPLYMNLKDCKRILESHSPSHQRFDLSNFSLHESTRTIREYIRTNFTPSLPARSDQFSPVERMAPRFTSSSFSDAEETSAAASGALSHLPTEEYVLDCPFPQLNSVLVERPLNRQEIEEKNELGLTPMEYRTTVLFTFSLKTITENSSLKKGFNQMQRGAVIKSLNSVFSKFPEISMLAAESSDEEIIARYKAYKNRMKSSHKNFSFITQLYNQWKNTR